MSELCTGSGEAMLWGGEPRYLECFSAIKYLDSDEYSRDSLKPKFEDSTIH
jgi:hypothetical protein